MAVDSELAPLLGAIRVVDESGTDLELGRLWRDGAAVLVLVRHFGCVFCQQQVAELARRRADIEASGATLAVIGNGSPSFIAGVRELSGFDGPMYTDPTRRVHTALGMKRTVISSLNIRTLGRALWAYRLGHRQGDVQGDPWQQGGIAIVAPSGERMYEYRSAFAGDHPPIDDLVAAVRGRRAA